MRPALLIAGLALVLFALVASSDQAEAVHTGSTQKGCAMIEVVSATFVADQYALRTTTDGTPQCPDGGTWELDAGASITVTFETVDGGIGSPSNPTNTQLLVYFDDELSVPTLVRTLSTGAMPADGTQYTFHATHNGESSGTPAAGTYRLRVRVVGGGGANPSYECGSDGDAAVGAGVSCRNPVAGYLRSRMLASSITASAPPSGSTFAYGASGNEQVTCQNTYSRAIRSATYQDVRADTTRDSPLAQIKVGTATDASTAGTLNQAHTIDNAYDASSTTYGCRLVLLGNSPLSGLTWTVFASTGHGTGVVRESDTSARRDNRYTADPRIIFSSNGAARDDNATITHLVYNRGETVTGTFYVLNARDQQLTRASVNVLVRDKNTGTTEESLTLSPTAGQYSFNYVIAASDAAAATTNGRGKVLRYSPPSNQANSATTHAASSLYHADSHCQKLEPLNKDDWPTPDATEDLEYVSGEDLINCWVHVTGVRQDGTDITTTGNAVTLTLKNAALDTVATGTGDTGADGWTALLITHSASAPTGHWEAIAAVTFNGNTGTDTETLDVLSAFSADKVIRMLFNITPALGNQETIWVLLELNDQNSTPIAPPTLRIGTVRLNANYHWSEHVEAVEMVNAVNWTQTVNGSLYAYNITWDKRGPFNIWVSANFNGTIVRDDAQVYVMEAEAMPIEIQGYDSSALIELGIWTGIILFAMFYKLNLLVTSGIIGFLRPIIGDAYPLAFTGLLVLTLLVLVVEYTIRNKMIPGTKWGDATADGGE